METLIPSLARLESVLVGMSDRQAADMFYADGEFNRVYFGVEAHPRSSR